MTDEQKAALDLAVLNLKTHGDDQLLSAVQPLIEFYESRVLAERDRCVGCEGKPSGTNIPCAVCGTHPTPDDASDAARYRWLRAQMGYHRLQELFGKGSYTYEMIDTRIDAAMQADKEAK